MVIGAARVVLHLPECHSLKDKRQILKSLVRLTQNEFRLSVAEVERQDQWQIAVLGLACVSSSVAHADEVLAHAVSFIEARHRDGTLLDYQTETIHAL